MCSRAISPLELLCNRFKLGRNESLAQETLQFLEGISKEEENSKTPFLNGRNLSIYNQYLESEEDTFLKENASRARMLRSDLITRFERFAEIRENARTALLEYTKDTPGMQDFNKEPFTAEIPSLNDDDTVAIIENAEDIFQNFYNAVYSADFEHQLRTIQNKSLKWMLENPRKRDIVESTQYFMLKECFRKFGWYIIKNQEQSLTINADGTTLQLEPASIDGNHTTYSREAIDREITRKKPTIYGKEIPTEYITHRIAGMDSYFIKSFDELYQIQ